MKRQFRGHLVQAAQVASVAPAWTAGIRAAVATLVPILVGQSLHWPSALWMGLAGFNVAFSDRGGAMRTRVAAMTASACWAAIAVFAGGLAAHDAIAAVAIVALWATAGGLVRAYGPAATTAGVISLVSLLVAIGAPATPRVAAMNALAVLGGSAFAMVLALVVWPVRIYRPARVAIADAYRAAAAAHAAPHDEALRAAAVASLAHARTMLAAVRRGLQNGSARGEQLLILAESLDRLLPRANGDAATAALLASIADSVDREDATLLRDARVQHDDVLDAALTAARELEGDVPAAEPLSFRARFIDPIRSLLTWESDVLRHALRVAAAVAIAVAVVHALHIARGYWLTVTVIVILQPYTSMTFQKGLQRVAGTIAGGIAAALLLATVHSSVGLLVMIFVSAAVTIALLRVNYGLYSLFVTITFVLLAEVGRTDWHLVWLRVGSTLGGAAIAYLAAWLLWPASERGRVRDDLAAALDALAEYARCLAICDDANAARSRQQLLVALQNADVSLQRLLSDAFDPDEERMMAVLLYARKFAAAFGNLAQRGDDRTAIAPLARYANAALAQLAASVRAGTPAQPVAADGARGDADGGAGSIAQSVAGSERAIELLASLRNVLADAPR
jgi:uncharacterized membrane protein YccC